MNFRWTSFFVILGIGLWDYFVNGYPTMLKVAAIAAAGLIIIFAGKLYLRKKTGLN